MEECSSIMDWVKEKADILTEMIELKEKIVINDDMFSDKLAKAMTKKYMAGEIKPNVYNVYMRYATNIKARSAVAKEELEKEKKELEECRAVTANMVMLGIDFKI